MPEIRLIAADDLVENVPTPGMERREAASGGARIIAVRTPGDFFIVPPETVHRESNPANEEQVIVGFRLGSGVTVVNVDGPR